MQTKYEKGRAFEYACKRHLEELGYNVWRTPGSKSAADLIANYLGQFTMLVQCQTSKPFSKIKVDKLRALALKCRWIPAIAYKEDKKIKVEEV